MTNKKWSIIKSNYLIQNKWLTVRKDHVRLPSGTEIDDYYVLEYPDWSTIIAVTKDGKFVMERQYRHGIQQTSIELCGGTVEEGESPLDTAKRELLEEAGYAGGVWSEYAPTAPNPSAMTNICHTFIAVGVEKVSEQKLETTEDIDIVLMLKEELIEAMRNGEISRRYAGSSMALYVRKQITLLIYEYSCYRRCWFHWFSPL